MNINECFELGIITKPHGFTGGLVLFIDADNPKKYAKLDTIFVQKRGPLLPYLIETINVNSNRAIVKLKGVDTEEAALALKDCKVFVPDSWLSKGNSAEYLYHEVIDFKVNDEHYGVLGTITCFYTMPNQDYFGMEYKGEEILIPINDQIIAKVDKVAKIVNTRIPIGLIEVYIPE